jgi:hypothetical protein
MKHATILYTCIGLMGAAAIAGFADYSSATKAGLLKGLYAEEKATSVNMLPEKEIELEDYSRAAFDYEQSIDTTVVPGEKVKKKHKKYKDIPPPPPVPETPPAPETVKVKNVLEAPPAPEVPGIIEIPVIAPEPAIPSKTEKVIAPIVISDTVELVEMKEVSMKSFSRGPLKSKKVISKKKEQ